MFLFIPCQVGSERVLKDEIDLLYHFKSAFSSSGFVTFKVPDGLYSHEVIRGLMSQLVNRSVFSRMVSLSLGKLFSANLVESVWQLVLQSQYFINRIHVFCRDRFMPGQNGFEPSIPSDLRDLHSKLVLSYPYRKFLGVGGDQFEQPAFLTETVLDVVRVDVDLYFVGVHFVTSNSPLHIFYPGGIIPIQLPTDAVSRAWLKFEEGLRWSGLPIGAGACCVDIGAAPGGGSQVLLARGAEVLGVDPAEIAPVVLNNPKFKHIRGKINQTQRSLYKNVRWVIADVNVAPKYTLDVLEEMIKRNSKIKGMLFTLKLPQLELAKQIPQFLKRIRNWGFRNVQAKQLVFNRREIMVAVQD
jgi:23S rRNA (cytidine2498-2'-O)-methyltransferase